MGRSGEIPRPAGCCVAVLLSCQRLRFGMLALAVCIIAGAARADSLADGKMTVAAVCQTCHGMDGLGGIAGVPVLSGQKQDYMIIQLEAYRGGGRQHPQMSIIAKTLSDEDIRNVAAWYSAIKISVTLPE